MPTQTATQRSETKNSHPTTPQHQSAGFEGIGWNVRLQQKRSYYFLTLAKEIVVGNALQRGDPLNYYLVDCNGRKAILTFLDGQQRPAESIIKLNRITFLVKK